MSSVKEALASQIRIDKTHLWLDSKTEVCWIKGSKEWKQFVQNRVNEILSLTEESMWNHCPGIENPADIGSRGEGAAKLKSNVLWWKGPSWLSEPMRNWPSSEECSETIAEECCVEMKKGQAIEAVGEAVLLTTNGIPNMDTIIPITDFSSCDKLFRITALVLPFVKNLKIKAKLLKIGTVYLGDVTAEELGNAEMKWLRSVQNELKSQANYSQLELDFGLYEDSSGQFVKRTLASCTVCRRYEGKSYRVPPQSDLPEFRLSQKPAFTYVGVDYAGPLYIKVSGQSALQKVYVLLFTCCSVRAVHLELATDLSVDVFIRCLRRFAARRGLPELIISDNAKTFKAADKILSKLFSYPRVKKFLASKRIDWRFNVDRAPWWGGFFERLIQNTKRCLRKTLRNAKLNYDELHTVLVEVEGTLNSRPLTYVSSDDPEEPLTPSHLMYGRRILSLPEVTGNRQASLDHTVSSEDLPRRRKYLGLLLEHFWRRWSREYVTELRNLHRQKSRPRSSIAVSEGDVVTVFEDNLPRSQWKLGRVEQLIHGADDRVRAAVVKVISKSGRPVTMKRPVQRLFPLEIPVVSNDEQPREEQIIDGIRPPRRLAARNADYIRRLVDQ